VLEATAKTFRYLDPEEIAAQRKAAKPGAKGMKWTSVHAGHVLALSTALTSACSSGHRGLQPWMSGAAPPTRPKITPISEPKRYVPLVYSESAAADPFDSRG
jgi:hypothetical protein